MADFAFTNQDPRQPGAPNFLRPTPLVGTVDGVNRIFHFALNPGFSFVITVGGTWLVLTTDLTPFADFTYDPNGFVVTFKTAPSVVPIAYW